MGRWVVLGWMQQVDILHTSVKCYHWIWKTVCHLCFEPASKLHAYGLEKITSCKCLLGALNETTSSLETEESASNAHYHLSCIFMLNHIYIYFFPSQCHLYHIQTLSSWKLFGFWFLLHFDPYPERVFLISVECKEVAKEGTTLLLTATFKLPLQHILEYAQIDTSYTAVTTAFKEPNNIRALLFVPSC